MKLLKRITFINKSVNNRMAYKAYTFRLKPTTAQLELIISTAGACRWVWNHMLATNIARYDAERKFIFGVEQHKLLPGLKKENPWLGESNSQSLQAKCMDLDAALRRKIKNKTEIGFPRFKSKHHNSDSFRVPASFKLSNKGIKLPKIGWIRWKVDRKISGKAKSVTVKQDGDRWVAVVLCEVPDVEQRQMFADSEIIGIDVGIKDFAVLSNGDKIANPKHLEKSAELLKRKQRELSRKVKGSSNRNKARKAVAKLHRHVANQRKDFQWKLVASITKSYSVVAMEDLNIRGMMRNHKLARSISSAGWGGFKLKLQHKLSESGGLVIDVNPQNTSRMCSSCGALNHLLTLDVREWVCDCGARHDRDINAAVNIRSFGLNRLGTSRIYACREPANGDMAYDISSYGSLKQEKSSVGSTSLVL